MLEDKKEPYILVTKEFEFDAAHQLPNYAGKCEQLHGHTFKIHVTVKSRIRADSGIAYDFLDLKKIVNDRVVDILDHKYLNDFLVHPSAENLCLWIWENCSDLPLYEIKVWETPTSCATYREGL